MKKSFVILVLSLCCASIFAISYKNNTYQKLADEYAKKAEAALDAGEYETAMEYSLKAEENAALSKAFIEMMMVRGDADSYLKMAKNKFSWAESVNAAINYPMAYSAAKENLQNAQTAFDSEDYEKTEEYAKLVMDCLDGVEETVPLPEYYIVRPWAESKDCYWNIAGRSFVYNNPWLWENLYQANKNDMVKPENPNLIKPGMKMKIPSITGEYRTGTYNPELNYNTYE
ncbi:MAG: hypothetical protein MJ188_00650 [Treponema sp.]|nr:hypothetical protein [Treponema sp.]